MNPTVVAAFGVDKALLQVLPHNFYNTLHGESVTLASSIADFDTTALKVMNVGFKTYEVGDDQAVAFHKSNLFWNG